MTATKNVHCVEKCSIDNCRLSVRSDELKCILHVLLTLRYDFTYDRSSARTPNRLLKFIQVNLFSQKCLLILCVPTRGPKNATRNRNIEQWTARVNEMKWNSRKYLIGKNQTTSKWRCNDIRWGQFRKSRFVRVVEILFWACHFFWHFEASYKKVNFFSNWNCTQLVIIANFYLL